MLLDPMKPRFPSADSSSHASADVKPSHVPSEPQDNQTGDEDEPLTLIQKMFNYLWAVAVLSVAGEGGTIWIARDRRSPPCRCSIFGMRSVPVEDCWRARVLLFADEIPVVDAVKITPYKL